MHIYMQCYMLNFNMLNDMHVHVNDVILTFFIVVKPSVCLALHVIGLCMSFYM